MVMFESASVAQTNAGEHNHGSFVKNPWRRSNHRNPEEWMLRALEKDHAYLLTKGAEQKKSKRVRRECEILGDPHSNFSLEDFDEEKTKLRIPDIFVELLKTSLGVFEDIWVYCYNSICIPPTDPLPGYKVTASHSFYGSPRYDSIKIIQEAETKFAKLLLIFRIKHLRRFGEDLVLVQTYRPTTQRDSLQLPIIELTDEISIISINDVISPVSVVPLAPFETDQKKYYINLWFEVWNNSK